MCRAEQLLLPNSCDKNICLAQEYVRILHPAFRRQNEFLLWHGYICCEFRYLQKNEKSFNDSYNKL